MEDHLGKIGDSEIPSWFSEPRVGSYTALAIVPRRFLGDF
jgi:hypothetical protein